MKVYELLSSPEKWAQGSPAMDKYGCPVNVFDSAAVKWCIMGGVEKCYGPEQYSEIRQKIKNVVHTVPTDWNDDPDREHGEVIALMRRLDI